MLAPVKVLHLPTRAGAVERFGEEAAQELMADGAATPLAEIIAEVLATRRRRVRTPRRRARVTEGS